MGESRKRKSLWDMEDEAKFSSSGKASALKSRDHSGRSNWESVDGNAVDRFYKDGQDNAEARELGRGKTYDKNLTRGFDGAEWHKRDHTPEYDWGGSGRYPGRGRSWSRSRSKSRSRSRSRSRGGRRGRSRSPDKARDRGRDRRRSRSRSNGSARGQMGNRTPIGEYRQSGGWSEGNRHEKSSRSCREFLTGRCNKGSQCRFLHPDNTGSSHRNHVEDERGENWRNRPELGRISGYSNDRGPGPRSRDDAYNSYHEEDDYSRSQSRNAVPCRDFVKGSCRWGDTCRFSHHEASGDSYGKGTRNASYGRDIEQQANRNVKPLCKFFAAGKCFRDNCRFSHDSPELHNVEGRPGEDTSSFSLDNKGKWWNGPSWNDSVDVSDKVKSTGWSEDVANTNIVGVTTIGGTDDRLDHRRESEGRTRGIQKQNDDYMKRDQQLSFPEDEGSPWGIPKQNDDYMKRDQQLSLSENEGRTWEIPKQNDDHRKIDRQLSLSENEGRTWEIPKENGDYMKRDQQLSRSVNEGRTWEIPKQNDDYRKIDRQLSLSENEGRTWEIPKQNDDYIRRDQQLSLSENEGRTWEIPKQNDDYYRKRDQEFSLSGGGGSYDVEMDITEPLGKDNITNNQVRIFHESRSQNADAISHLYGQNTMQEGQGLAIKASQNDVFADSHIQQHHQRQAENVSSFGSNAFDEVNGSRNSKFPVLFPGQIFKQNGESLSPGHPMFSNETDRNQHILIDLNGPEQHKMSPGLQYQTQNLQNKTPEMSDVQPPQFVSDAVDNEQVVQMTKSSVGITSEQGVPVMDSSAVMAQMLVKEEQPPQVYAGLDTSGSIGILPSYADTTHFNPLVNTMNGQSNQVTNSLDLLDSLRNVKADTGTNHNPASDTVCHSGEQKNQVHVEQSSMPTINHVFGSSTAQQHDSSKVKEQTVVEESKGGQENKHSENVDGHGKVDDSSVVKDDKGLRLFKNALVEFVKEILKPTWKEGWMSREVHKAIVKKVVDKVTCTIPNEHVPKTQNKVDQYLTTSKPKISKLVQAYVERSLKPEP